MSVLIYLRDPAAYIVSGRRQWVRNGPHPRFPYGSALPLNDVVGHPWFSNHLDYLGMVHSMRSVFGHDAVIVAAYRRDVLPDFLRRIGVPDDAISTPGDLRMNPGIRPGNLLGQASAPVPTTRADEEQVVHPPDFLGHPHQREPVGVGRLIDSPTIGKPCSTPRPVAQSRPSESVSPTAANRVPTTRSHAPQESLKDQATRPS